MFRPPKPWTTMKNVCLLVFYFDKYLMYEQGNVHQQENCTEVLINSSFISEFLMTLIRDNKHSNKQTVIAHFAILFPEIHIM